MYYVIDIELAIKHEQARKQLENDKLYDYDENYYIAELIDTANTEAHEPPSSNTKRLYLNNKHKKHYSRVDKLMTIQIRIRIYNWYC